MSLNSEKNWRTVIVPRMHLVDRLIDSIFVLLPHYSVMLDVINKFKVASSSDGVGELELERAPS